jgi:hypothetical protein
MRTIEDCIDAECAWNLLKEIERLQHLLLQRYHDEFIEIKQKEECNFQSGEDLPF